VHLLIQVGGALLILAAFTAAQSGRLDPHARSYLALNLVGSAILTYDALCGHEWEFFVLESVWALVSARSLVRGPPRRTRDIGGRAGAATHSPSVRAIRSTTSAGRENG
jgi:hypothetical protein